MIIPSQMVSQHIARSLDAERCAIGVYEAMVEKTRHVDPVTQDLAKFLLADEVADEDETETLLGVRALQRQRVLT